MGSDRDEDLPARRPQAAPALRREPDPEPPPIPELRDLPLAPYEGVGDLGTVLGRDEAERLTALLTQKIPTDWLNVKPDGAIYLPQVYYRRLLLQAFGIGGWGLRPLRGMNPQVIKSTQWAETIMWPMELVVRGVVVAVGMGEASYSKNNARSSLATAAESAKSDALVRCCKDFGIASEAWDPVYARNFQREHCVRVRVKVTRNGNTKMDLQWRRKDADPLPDEVGLAPEGERPPEGTLKRPESTDDPVGVRGDNDERLDDDPAEEMRRTASSSTPAGNGYITQKDIVRLMIRCKDCDVTEDQLKEYILGKYGCRSRKQVKVAWLGAILTWVESRAADPPPDEPGAGG